MSAAGIDPATSAPLALRGRIVTMDDHTGGHNDGVLYMRDGSIVAVSTPTDDAPEGFEQVEVLNTAGTIYPGLIELHNHLPYDILSLWDVPKLYENRDQWSGSSTPDYRQLISGPMGILGKNTTVVPAVVRYVEVRCMLGGTTTSQGVALASNAGIVKHFRGLVRNVESTGDPELPVATTHIADIDATDAEHFLARISGTQKIILHLAEGLATNESANNHFQALQISPGRWAITENLIGIHCAALHPADFQVFADHGGSMVWSPLSNLLLYGETADVKAALQAGVPIALGSDWAPSGSKNLLGELKVARIYADIQNLGLTPQKLIAMATSTPARMLGWGDKLGTLAPGKRADLIVVHGIDGDRYAHLLEATEADIDLVVVNGVPRSGTVDLMTSLGLDGEEVDVAGQPRVLSLAQTTADPDVEGVTVAEAINRLTSALAQLSGASLAPAALAASPPGEGESLLAVEGVLDNHMTSRPHLPLNGTLTGPNLPSFTSAAPDAVAAAADPPAPPPVFTLDPLTAVDNPAFYTELDGEQNIPQPIRDRIVDLAP